MVYFNCISTYSTIEGENKMIEIKNLTKSFNQDKIVLENLNCTIKDNAIYGLVGANGAGKSTLLRLICSIYEADSGTIFIDGKDSFDNEQLKQNMVFVPDDLFFYSGYTLMEMAEYYESLYHNFDMNYVITHAGKLKLNMQAKINTLSKGMKRQCALLCSLATKAKYMLFDETFDGLDPVVRKYFKSLLADLIASNSSTIIMTSHNLRELEDICDNLGLLYKGNILFESDIDTIKTTMYKVQISLKKDFNKSTFKGLKILSYKKIGSIATIIIDENGKDSRKFLEGLNPLILDYLPLTLEEVFIYQMEALGYEFNEIV